jgi:hypothetical protein
MPHRRLTKESVASKKETLPKRITSELLNKINLELIDWLMITDVDELEKKREHFANTTYRLLTQKQIDKLEVLPVLTEHYCKLFFRRYPTLESYIEADCAKLYEDSMGRMTHPERRFSERVYELRQQQAVRYGVLDENII